VCGRGGIEAIREAALRFEVQPAMRPKRVTRPTRTPRFLPAPCRHGPAPFRAFVLVEGDPPRPRRRELPAGGPPTVFGPRHRRRARWLAKDPRPQARERAEAGTEPRAERDEA
jgi:hypothetical protein